MERKSLGIIILIVALGASGVGNIVLLAYLGFVEVTPPEARDTIIFGTMYGPVDADPVFAWDSASFDVLYQVYEGLFMYNLSDPGLPITPMLASGMGTYSSDNLELTIPLRQGVKFHDDTKFNATAVKFSFDRLDWFLNVSGDLWANTSVTQIKSLYIWPDGTTIINSTEILSEYSIKIVLNKPFGPFHALLSFPASFIFSPTSTPEKEYLETSTATGDDYVGTGPYAYDGYMAGIEVRFHAFEDYWQGKAVVEKLVFSVIRDSDARNAAILAGDINILPSPHPSWYAEMRAAENLTFVEAGQNTISQYLGFNNKLLNKTWRLAMSWAINYTYMIDELLEGEAVRMKSPVPEGIMYANYSFDCPVFNITRARQIMNGMGYGVGFTTDAQWITVAEGTTPFYTVNLTYNLGNKFREDMYTLLHGNFKYIGIKVEDAGLEWDPYLDRLQNIAEQSEGFDSLSIYFIGWMPDYNDPSNFINPLMSNISSSNSAQINDPHLEELMLAGLEETDPVLREAIYDEMQKYIVEDLVPWAFGYNGLNRDVWVSTMHGFPSNVMGYNYFYPCYFD